LEGSNALELVRCKMSDLAFLRKGDKAAMATDGGRTVRRTRLIAWARALRRAASVAVTVSI